MIEDGFKIRYKSVPVAISETNHFLPTKLHNHSEFEILLINSGSSNVRIANKDYRVKGGDMIFINPMEIHEIIANEDTSYAHQCMCFDISVIMNNRISEKLKKECTSIVHVIKGETEHGQHLRGLFEKIYNEVKNESNTSAMEITAYITLMFSYLLKNSLLDEKRENPKETEFCSKILDYVNKHYGEKITSRQAADACFLNHSYFCRKFKDNFGISFSEYLNIYRISMARTMLEEDAENVSRVSEMCGFYTPAYFSKCFKQHIGVSPFEYKKSKNSL